VKYLQIQPDYPATLGDPSPNYGTGFADFGKENTGKFGFFKLTGLYTMLQ
jgi:hypothetical protein